MTAQYVEETVSAEDVSLSQMVWALFRRQPVGYLERVYEANQNLASLGYFIPVGTVVRFPILDIPDDVTRREVVRLWD